MVRPLSGVVDPSRIAGVGPAMADTKGERMSCLGDSGNGGAVRNFSDSRAQP